MRAVSSSAESARYSAGMSCCQSPKARSSTSGTVTRPLSVSHTRLFKSVVAILGSPQPWAVSVTTTLSPHVQFYQRIPLLSRRHELRWLSAFGRQLSEIQRNLYFSSCGIGSGEGEEAFCLVG